MCEICLWIFAHHCSTISAWVRRSWYVIRQAERAGIEARVDAEPLLQELATDRAVVCFRIVQEAVTNVLRHAGATRLDVALRKARSGFELSIKDNGRGFRVSERRAEAPDRWTLGLLGMRERARTLGGNLTIQSDPGRGTEVVAQIPLQDPRET